MPVQLVAAAKAGVKAVKVAKDLKRLHDNKQLPRLTTKPTMGWWFVIPPLVMVTVVILAFVAPHLEPPAPDNCQAGLGAPVGTAGAGASADINPTAMDRINALTAMYQRVGAAADVAPAALAALDYRENNNDPNASMLSGEAIGAQNPDDHSVTTTSKEDSAQRAAEHFRSMASSVYGVTVTSTTGGEDMKLAFLAYNRGYIYSWAGVGPDQSPYVVNMLDASHTDMVWPNITPGTGDPRNPGEPMRGHTEVGRYGAYTLFSRLGGATGRACNAGFSADASALLNNPRVVFSRDSQKADLESGQIDPRIIGVLSWMAERHVITITSLKTDHSACAGGSKNETGGGGCSGGLSNHGFGRAADVSLLDGERVSSANANARAVVDDVIAADGQMGLTELGQPFYDRSVGALYVFTADHGDHIHIGIDESAGPPPPTTGGVPASGLPTGWSESNDCEGTRDGAGTHWGVTNPNVSTIFYCPTKIDAGGGSESLWNYVRQHERCHARAVEGYENFDYTNEHEADLCAARNGADIGWSPY